MQSCDRTIEPYYMSLSELKQYLKYISSKDFVVNGKPINTIHLTGGDPLTHPQWKDFCDIIHQYLPKMKIAISTNGLFLSRISDKELIELNQKYNIEFQFSIYADKNLLAMYKKILKRLNKLNMNFSFGGNSHFFFSKQNRTSDVLEEENFFQKNIFQDKCNKSLSKQDHVILYKGKIYSCWTDINILQKENHLTDDAIILNENTPKELMQNKRHYYCNICQNSIGSGGKEYILWQHHNKNAEKIFNFNLRELFIYDYPLYYSLQHECKDMIEILQDELFIEHFPEEQKHYTDTRFFNGKGDIFIPFKTFVSDELKTFLQSLQDIYNYNIYFISINNSSQVEEQAYNIFCPFLDEEYLNSYFLKANNMFNAYKTFLDNSYLSNKFFIDIEQKNFELIPFNNT